MMKLLPFLLYVRKWAKVTDSAFPEKSKNPFLKEGFRLLFEGKEISIIGITFQLAQFDQKCAGYPIGGSLAFAQRLADRYVSLGGRTHYGAAVKKILVEADTDQASNSQVARYTRPTS